MSLILGIAYLAFGVWLSLRLLKLFLGPLMAVAKAEARIQFFVTDYYVLLGEIAIYTLPFLSDTKEDVNPLILPFVIGMLGICWFVVTRALSKGRVRKFGPRLLGQILFPFQMLFAVIYGFAALPMLIGLFVGGLPVVAGLAVAFFIFYLLSTKASALIARQADVIENEQLIPNPSNESNVPPAA